MEKVFFDPGYDTLWTAVAAIAQTAASFLALTALIYSIHTFRKSQQASHYTELDTMYFEILRLRFERPHLRSQGATRTSEEQGEYDTYAHMVWNFLETVADRCERDASLCATWYPVIDTESSLYRDWFDLPANKRKFKRAFHSFVEGRDREASQSEKPREPTNSPEAQGAGGAGRTA